MRQLHTAICICGWMHTSESKIGALLHADNHQQRHPEHVIVTAGPEHPERIYKHNQLQHAQRRPT